MTLSYHDDKCVTLPSVIASTQQLRFLRQKRNRPTLLGITSLIPSSSKTKRVHQILWQFCIHGGTISSIILKICPRIDLIMIESQCTWVDWLSYFHGLSSTLLSLVIWCIACIWECQFIMLWTVKLMTLSWLDHTCRAPPLVVVGTQYLPCRYY